MPQLGKSFARELEAAGLGGKKFTWTSDGMFYFDPEMTAEERLQVQALADAHDPHYVHPLDARVEQDETEKDQIKALTTVTELLDLTPEEIDTYIDAQTTDTNGIRLVLKVVVKMLVVAARRALRD